jgi:hypothetical protein
LIEELQLEKNDAISKNSKNDAISINRNNDAISKNRKMTQFLKIEKK